MRRGRLIDVASDGVEIVQTAGIGGNGRPSQHWKLTPVSGGAWFTAVNRASGKVLTVSGAPAAPR